MGNFKLETLPKDEYFFGLFVGDNGSGKTCAAASFPKPICVIDIDKRIKGVNGAPWVQGKDQIYVEWLKGDHLLLELEGLFSQWEVDVKNNKFKYETIILDGFTSTAMVLIDNSFSLTGKMKEAGNRSAQGHPKIGTVDLPGLDEFGYELAGFKNIMTFLKYGLKCNVICTAHWVERWGRDDKGNSVVIGKKVNLRNSITPNVLLWFDNIFYFEKSMASKAVSGVGAVRYEKHTVEFRNELARTVFAKLPSQIDITEKELYPEIIKYLELEEKKDATSLSR